MQQAIGMRALQVSLHSLWTEHAAIKGKLLPGFEADHLIIFHFQLQATLLSAKAAVRFHKAVRRNALIEPLPAGICQVWAKGFDKCKRISRFLSHREIPPA